MTDLNKKLMNTPNLSAERLEKLKELFPDLFTIEGKLNPDEFKKIIDPELVKETERFEFKWFGKSEAKRTAFTPSRATLVYDEKRSVNPEYADGNMIIEGENLESLKVLLSGYRERIKCIYIDPPYNVDGDFVYNDNWDESKEDYWEHIGVTSGGVKIDTNTEANGRYHSNWLNMIYTRLLLARQLLANNGLIFISIDDNELYHLRKICNEIFGDENFIADFVWNSEGHTDNQYDVKINHEYILVFCKNFNYAKLGYVVDPNTREESNLWKGYAENSITKNGAGNPPSEVLLPKGFPVKIECIELPANEPNNTYYEEIDQVGYITRQMTDKYNVIYPIRKDRMIATRNQLSEPCRVFSGWANVNKLREFIKNSFEPITEENGDKVSFYLSENGVIYYYKKRDKARNILSVLRNMGTTEQMRSELESMGVFFSYPKPKELIKYILKIGLDEDDYVLDFFAGSGTTAHAVMELNREDGDNRKFILIQIPELTDEKSEAYKAGYKKISDISIERNNRVIEKIEKDEKEKNPDLFSEGKKPFKTGFKVYKLAKSNFPRVDFAPDPTKSEDENLALLDKYIEEKEAMYLAMVDEKNIFDEVLLKNGFMLNYKLEQIAGFTKNKVFYAKDDYKECLICMEIEIKKETLNELEKYKDKIFICLERSLDTTMKWNLKHLLGDKLVAF